MEKPMGEKVAVDKAEANMEQSSRGCKSDLLEFYAGIS